MEGEAQHALGQALTNRRDQAMWSIICWTLVTGADRKLKRCATTKTVMEEEVSCIVMAHKIVYLLMHRCECYTGSIGRADVREAHNSSRRSQ